MKDFSGGLYLVLNSTPIFPGDIPLVEIEYKYNSRKVLGFIATEGGGVTESDDPYLSCLPEIFLMLMFAPLFDLTC